MEPEGSLPYSQVPATCPYPESTRSSTYPPGVKHVYILNELLLLLLLLWLCL